MGRGPRWKERQFVDQFRRVNWTTMTLQREQRWAVVGLLLWTPVVLGSVAGIVYLAGHWIFRIW
jgi:hypothetical protein